MPLDSEDSRYFFTQQVMLIGTNDPDGREHFAPISWISYSWGQPTCLILSMNGIKQTKKNIDREAILSASILTPELLPFAESCNRQTKSERVSNLTPDFARGSELDVPLIVGNPWSFECRVIETVLLGDTHTYFAEIIHVNIRDDIKELDFVDLRVIDPVVYSPMNYFRIGEHLGRIGDFSPKD